MTFRTRELSPSTWGDFEALMIKQGQCWCMYYQRPQSWEKEAKMYGVTKKKELMRKGQAHGILVYDGERPIGWCAYGRSEEFPRVDKGRLYRKLGMKNDGLRLWRITCFYVDSEYRRKGIAQVALRSALESIAQQGGGVVEAYPRVSKEGGSLWFGTIGMLERQGFRRVGPLGASILVRRDISWSRS